MFSELAAAVIASVLTASILRLLAVHREIAAHDQRVREIDEDLRRWVRDRDRERTAELSRTANRNARTGLLYSGRWGDAFIIVARQVREEWRNELSAKLREFRSLAGAEGRLHELVRRWRGRRRSEARPALELPEDVREKLATWRGPIDQPPRNPIEFEDPMAPDLEPDLAEFEQTGRRELPRIDLRTGTPRM